LATSGPNVGRQGGHPTDTESSTDRARAPAPDDEAQPDYRRGPGRPLEGKVWPPGTHGAAANRQPRETPIPPKVTDLCGLCGGHHATEACPTLLPPDEQDHPRPRSGGPAPGRGLPQPWAAPRRNPAPEVAKAGRAAVEQALAEHRAAQGQPAAEPPPTTEEQRMAKARRQVADARRERDPLPGPPADEAPDPIPADIPAEEPPTTDPPEPDWPDEPEDPW
jgi:hypothetical protein